MAGYHFKDPVLTVPKTSVGWFVSEHLTGAQSSTVLRTPPSGERLYLDRLVLAVTENAVVSISIGETMMFQVSIAANVPVPSKWTVFGAVDEPLTVTSSAGDLYVNITGYDA